MWVMVRSSTAIRYLNSNVYINAGNVLDALARSDQRTIHRSLGCFAITSREQFTQSSMALGTQVH